MGSFDRQVPERYLTPLHGRRVEVARHLLRSVGQTASLIAPNVLTVGMVLVDEAGDKVRTSVKNIVDRLRDRSQSIIDTDGINEPKESGNPAGLALCAFGAIEWAFDRMPTSSTTTPDAPPVQSGVQFVAEHPTYRVGIRTATEDYNL